MSNNLTDYLAQSSTQPRYVRTRRRSTIQNGNNQARFSPTRNASKRITGPKPVSYIQPTNTVWFTKGVETVKRSTSMTNQKNKSGTSIIDAETKLKCSWAKPLPAVVAVNKTTPECQQWANWSFV